MKFLSINTCTQYYAVCTIICSYNGQVMIRIHESIYQNVESNEIKRCTEDDDDESDVDVYSCPSKLITWGRCGTRPLYLR